MSRPIKAGSTGQSTTLRILATDGTPKADVTYASSGLALWYRRQGGSQTSITPASLSALTDAHAAGGFLHIGDGYYRLDGPTAAFATGSTEVMFGGAVTDGVIIGSSHPLVAYDPQDGVRLGITALPPLPAANGPLITSGTGFYQLATYQGKVYVAGGGIDQYAIDAPAVTKLQAGLQTASQADADKTEILAAIEEGDSGGLTEAQAAQLESAYERTLRIGSGAALFVNSSVLFGGRIVLYQGEDRVVAAGNPLGITDADGTHLPAVGTAMRLQARHTADRSIRFEVEGAVVAGGEDAKIAQFDLPRTVTAELRTGDFEYFLFERVDDAWNKLEVAGPLTLKDGIAESAA